jgi:excisionase family DNA binding protein
MAKLFSVPQFAEALGVTVACCRRWTLERRVTFTKIGRLVRIPASEADRLIAEGLGHLRDSRSPGERAG